MMVLKAQIPPPPIHLSEPFRTGTDLEPKQLDSQEMAASAPASQKTSSSKRKRLTGNEVLKQQNEELARQLTERDESTLGGVVRTLQEELERQRQENERQRQENERQKQENERQKQESKQEVDELKDVLKQLVAAQSQKGREE